VGGLVTGVALLLAACASDPARHLGTAPEFPGCTSVVTDPSKARRVLRDAEPGSTVCVTGDLGGTELILTASGVPGAPVTLAGRDATVRTIRVDADHVVVEGFTVQGGDGLVLRGRGITARANTVRDARANGIECRPCTDARIESNVVERADGSGILIEGERITVHGNTISDSVMREANDADGVRFFGRGHVISDNTIRNIPLHGHPGGSPHPDCFQTYDNNRPPTVDVLIAGNRCEHIGQQCLIATAEEAGKQGMVGRSRSLTFVGNTCLVGASQAVLIRWFPDVSVRNNRIIGSSMARGVIFLDGSVGGEVTGNIFVGGFTPVEADDLSRGGLRTADNLSEPS